MNMLWLLGGLLLVVLAGLLWVVLRARSEVPPLHPARQAPAALPKAPPRGAASSWGITVVVPDPDTACPAVLRIQGRSFANEAAPSLPLSNCSSANCRCYYEPAPERRKTKERRSGEDRRAQLRFEPDKPVDRRSGKDRRQRKSYDWDHTV